MKASIMTLLTLALCSLGIAEAQNDPMKPIYQATFEDVLKPDYDEAELTIEGKRWKFVNARITTDSLSWIPQGYRAVEIMTAKTQNNPPRLELMDAIRGKAIAFALGFSGVDEMISGSQKDWKLEVTYDDGKSWISQNLAFDLSPSTLSFVVPDETKPFRFRIVYLNSSPFSGEGCRILIDNIRVTAPEDEDLPWEVHMGKLYDGYCTPENKISFKPMIFGTGWFLGMPGDDFGPNTYITTQIDDQEPQIVGTVNEETLVTFDNLSTGKHTITMRFVDLKTGKPFEPFDPHSTLDFYVRPAQQVKGLRALRQGREGEMYEVLPQDNRPIWANYWFFIHAQKWLFDGQAGIILDDPMRYDYKRKIQPEQKIQIKKMRGQLVRMNNNLTFRITEPLVLDTLDQHFVFENQTIEDLSLLTASGNIEQYEGMSVALSQVRYSALVDNPEAILYPIANDRYVVEDQKGNELTLQNIYPNNFGQSSILKETEDRLSDVYLDIFGIVGRSYPENEPTVFPIVMIKSDRQSVARVYPPTQLHVSTGRGYLLLSSDEQADIHVYNIRGEQMARISVHDAGKEQRIDLPQGQYLIRAHMLCGRVEVAKCIL